MYRDKRVNFLDLVFLSGPSMRPFVLYSCSLSFVHLSVCRSIQPSIHLSNQTPIHLPIHPPIHRSNHLLYRYFRSFLLPSIHPSIRPSIQLENQVISSYLAVPLLWFIKSEGTFQPSGVPYIALYKLSNGS